MNVHAVCDVHLISDAYLKEIFVDHHYPTTEKFAIGVFFI